MTNDEKFIKQLETYFDTVFDKYSRNRILGYLKEYSDELPNHIPIIVEKVVYRNLKIKDIEAKDTNQIFHNPTDIINLVAHATGINIGLMTGKRREANIIFARHVSMYLIRELCNYTLKDVGKIFNRDHTTIISAHTHVIQMIETGSEAYEKLIGYVKYHLTNSAKKTA